VKVVVVSPAVPHPFGETAARIVDLLGDAAQRGRFREAGRALVEAPHARATVLEQMLQVYEAARRT
jgi:hypothetical protein